MKQFLAVLVALITFGGASIAQQKEKMTREDKDEKNSAREARIARRNDLTLFKKQIMGIPEFGKEKRKIPALQKNNKGVVKVVAYIDSTENEDDAKTFIGYIRQDIGDNSTNMYELIYDRAQKKIISVKLTAEGAEANKEEADEKEEKAAEKKPTGTKAAPKKKKTDDDDDPEDEPEEKPSKSKQKDKEDE